jgi:mRNA interferase MazF
VVKAFQQGDIIYLNFDPQAGHEQKSRRPALVVSNDLYNRSSNLTMVCPITHTDRRHPFHVRLDERTQTDGFILCDQARMLDLNSRQATFEEKAPAELVAEVVDLIIGFVEIRCPRTGLSGRAGCAPST